MIRRNSLVIYLTMMHLIGVKSCHSCFTNLILFFSDDIKGEEDDGSPSSIESIFSPDDT